MSTALKASLEERVSALEEEVSRLRIRLNVKTGTQPWWESIAGTFANDPIYAEAMRLGRQWRESTRPRRAKKPKKTRSRKP